MNYKDINQRNWNKRVASHMVSDFYKMPAFKSGATSLKEIELALLPKRLDGQQVLHLQCHFGQDSLSLARMGAEVVGIDLSDVAIDQAKELAEELQLPAKFVCGDVYETPILITQQFDWVFTTYGVLGWLPDMQQWAKTVSSMLKPGGKLLGKLLLVEFHPVVWMFNDAFTELEFAYHNTGPLGLVEESSYANPEEKLELEEVVWNHGLAEVINPLLDQGMKLEHFSEYDYSPYPCFSPIEQVWPSRYQIAHLKGKLPMVYATIFQKM